MAKKKKQETPVDESKDSEIKKPQEEMLDLSLDVDIECTDCPTSWFGKWFGNCSECGSNAILPIGYGK